MAYQGFYTPPKVVLAPTRRGMPGGYQAKPASKGGALKAMSDTALGAGMMEGGRKVVERMAGIKAAAVH